MALRFAIGKMRQIAILQKNQPVDDDSGGQGDIWVNVLTTRCQLEKARGGKGIEEGSLQFNKEYVMACRYQSDLIIDPSSRWIINGQPYQIMDFEVEDQINHIFIFTLQKVDA